MLPAADWMTVGPCSRLILHQNFFSRIGLSGYLYLVHLGEAPRGPKLTERPHEYIHHLRVEVRSR
jgi:hypothetical protein